MPDVWSERNRTTGATREKLALPSWLDLPRAPIAAVTDVGGSKRNDGV